MAKNPFIEVFGRPKRRDSLTPAQREEISRRVKLYSLMVSAGLPLFPEDPPAEGEEVQSP